jgi:Fe-S-cluster containining protein
MVELKVNNNSRFVDAHIITKETPQKVVEKYGQECTKCHQCCKVDSGLVLEDDLQRLADHMNLPRDEFEEQFLVSHEKFNKKVWKLKQIKEPGKPFGRCVFLDDEKGCMVHEKKPLHCKVTSPKSKFGEQLSLWFVLNHLLDPHDPEAVRQWASYLKSHPTIPGGELHQLVPNKEKRENILSYKIFR